LREQVEEAGGVPATRMAAREAIPAAREPETLAVVAEEEFRVLVEMAARVL
jgi:hypothetical protein